MAGRSATCPSAKTSESHLGAVIEAVKRAGKSIAIIAGIRNSVKAYYTSLIEHKTLPDHSYATWMLDEGAVVRWVQAQLDHATIAQTCEK